VSESCGRSPSLSDREMVPILLTELPMSPLVKDLLPCFVSHRYCGRQDEAIGYLEDMALSAGERTSTIKFISVFDLKETAGSRISNIWKTME